MKHYLLLLLMSFTWCGILSAQNINEGFEGSMFPPHDWVSFIGTNNLGTTQNWMLSSTANSGSQAAYVRYESVTSGNTAEDWLVTPKLLPDTNNSTLSFHQRQEYSGEYNTIYTIRVSTTNQTTHADFTVVDTIRESDLMPYNQYIEHTVDLSAYIGQQIYIAFVMENNNGDSWYIDDVTGIPLFIASCPRPSPNSLSVGDITADAADLSWAAGGAEAAWEVVVQTAGTGVPTSSGVVATDSTYAATGLTANTNYEYYVRANCGTEFSDWSGPSTFTTACAAVSEFSENFDAVNTPDLPNCWSAITDNGAVASITTTSTNAPASEANHIRFHSSNSPSTSNVILVSPLLNNLNAGTHRLRFQSKHGYLAESLIVGTMSNPSDGSTFTALDTITITGEYTLYTKSFATYNGSDKYIAFRHPVSPGYRQIYLDDIIWEATPSCAEPSDLAVSNITSSSVDLSWMLGNEETAWEVVVQAPNTGTPTTAGTITSNNPHTVTGLTAGTSYEAYVRANCGTDSSPWIGPVLFSTACLAVSEFDENFDGVTAPNFPNCWSAIVNNSVSAYASVATTTASSPNTPDNHVKIYNSNDAQEAKLFLISPRLNNVNAGTHRIRFQGKRAVAPESVIIGTISNPLVDSTFTPLDTIALTQAYTQYIVNFSAYTTGTDEYIAFRHGSSSAYRTIFLDNIVWEAIPTCQEVSNVVLSGVTSNSVDVAWTAGSSETAWEVMAQPAGSGTPTTAGTSTTSNPHTETGLTPSTDYELYVRADCGEGDLSPWMGPFLFTTACASFTAPYIEDFSTMSSTAPPNCWEEGFNTQVSEGHNNTNGAWVSDGFMNNGSTGAARINLYFSIRNDWLVSPIFSIPTTGTYEVKYDFGITTYGSSNVGMLGSDDQVLFLISVDNGAWTTLATYDNNYVTPEGGDLGVSFNLDNYAGQNVRFAFWATEGTINDPEDIDVFVDNFMVKEILDADVGIIGITAPSSGCGLGMESISIQLENYGLNTQGGFFTHYSVNGVEQTAAPDGFIPNNTDSRDTTSYTFTTQYDFSAPGLYEIKAWTALETDGDNTNDTMTITIYSQEIISSLPYQEDFETSDGGYVVGNLSSASATVWEWGVPASTTIDTAAGGSKAWVTNLTGNYEGNSNTYLMSPCFDFSSLNSDPVLSFALWTNTEWDWDGVAVFTSTDGENFNRLGTNADENWYNNSDQQFQGIDSFQWDTVSHVLTNMAGKPSVKILYVFTSDGSGNHEGVGIDNISIIDPCAGGFGLASNVTNEAVGGQSGDGTATITNTMGTAPFSYQWSTGNPADTTNTISNVNAGTYSVTVTDSLGCADVLEVVIDATCLSDLTSNISYTPESQNSVTEDGTITINIASTYAPYTLSWSNGTQETANTTEASLSGLSAGQYYVTVTDAQGCSSVDSIVVTATCPLSLGLTTSFTVETTVNANDGTATATPTMGTAPYTYAWSTGATDQTTISNLSAGTVCVTVTDSNGCSENACVTIPFSCPSDMGLMLTVTHETVIGANDGSIVASTSAGTSPYQYAWSNNVAGNTVVDLAPGAYIVTVTDANGCTATASGTINASTISTPIEEIEGLRSLLLRPNPTSSSSTLSVRFDRAVNMEVQVLNIMGQNIQIHQFEQTSAADVKIDLKQAPSGIYFIRLKVGNNVHTERIIKQ